MRSWEAGARRSSVLVLCCLVLLCGVPSGGAAMPLRSAAYRGASVAVVGYRAAPVPAAAFRWPVEGVPLVVRGFDPPAQPWLPGHRGVDLAAEPGASVLAAGPGRVRFAGRVAGRGVVSVDHAGGLRTTYEPVTAVVRAGDRVRTGDRLGTLAAGHRGCPSGCLHWGLRRGEVYLDPLALLGLGRVRLLPLAPAGSG
jgi:murein DD-endopeptidase MepM/ murein hydrolase activator NlpD